jgi:peroxiredoxin
MRRLALAAAAGVLALVSPAFAGGANLNGRIAPELALTDGLNGASAATTLASLRGKVVCLKFWLTHCPVCQRTLPQFQEIHDRYGRSGVYCLGVVIDNAEGVGPFVRSKGYTFAVGCDPNRSNAARYGVNHYPADYVIGVDGVVRASNGFPREAIEGELRKVRALELGAVPAGLEAVRAAVEDGNYGEALRRGEAAAKAPGASAEVAAFVERLTGIASRRLENRIARAESWRAGGNVAAARSEAERIVADFAGTSLEARARSFQAAVGG